VEVDLGLHRVDGGVWGVAFGWLLGSSILAPISEEVWYRGYIFQNIKRGWGVAAGVVVNALVFGGLHLLNPNAELLGAVNIMLSAVIWTLGLLWFKSLWFPIGWHAAWNFAQFFFMGLPNSGYTVSDLGLNGTTLLVSELSGADWLVGGEFGMEASGVKTIVLKDEHKRIEFKEKYFGIEMRAVHETPLHPHRGDDPPKPLPIRLGKLGSSVCLSVNDATPRRC
jgi:hypothetical protein